MSNNWIAFLFAVGVSGWVYSKFYQRTGGNQQTSVPATAVVGIVVFLILLSILNRIS